MDSSYQEALDYLYSFVDYSLSKTFRYSPVKFELDRLRALMQEMGDPHLAYPVIHIAGTKGKGSVTSFCVSALQEAGYKVGMYTSPHLIDYTERIQVNSEPISRARLIDLVDEMKPYIENVPEITTFEITTALGFLYFMRENVDVAVIEVGLGGRLDATNIVNPVVTVITSISYDHMYLLGNTLTEIAGEKAGIIKPGIPVIVSPQEEEARLAIEKIANERQSPIVQVGKELLFAPISHSLDRQVMLVWPSEEQDNLDHYIESGGLDEWEPTRLSIPLLGYHQVENAATAYAALLTFRKFSLDITDTAIKDGFAKVRWPGRFELLQRRPPVILDSAHNRDSARKLRLALDDYFPGLPVILVFGASEDKDLHGMFAELMPRVDHVIATRSFHPRSLDPQMIMDMAHQFGHSARIVEDVVDAMDAAIKMNKGEAIVLITGSIFVVAGAREAWMKRTQAVMADGDFTSL
jgi:dihydrofolate synthase/folylpolyglutamate synthase